MQVCLSTLVDNIQLTNEMAGGVGLDLQHASVAIICEPWWNDNQMKQAICRLARQGQQRTVWVLQLHSPHSEVDVEVINTAGRKKAYTSAMMYYIVKRYDAEAWLGPVERNAIRPGNY